MRVTESGGMAGEPRTPPNQAYPELRLLIDGRWHKASGRKTEAVVNPATEAVIGHVPHASVADIERAIDAAARASREWADTPASQRSALLQRAGHWLRQRQEHWAFLITSELGKPTAQAQIEASTACDILDWAAGEARRLYGRLIPPRAGISRMMSIVAPIGPVAAVTGWNAPAITPMRKISSALAAGCPIVLKPSEATPASALLIAEAFEQAGLPQGVLNIVFGDPPSIGERFATDPRLRALTFTGGTAIGKHLGSLAAPTLKRLILELGGHAPAIILGDVDVDAVARSAAHSKYRNAGQVCTSPTRFLVERAIGEQFIKTFKEVIRDLRVGDPFDTRTGMGPLQNGRRRSAVSAMVADAERLGARVTRGDAPETKGFWFPPTVLTDVPDEAAICNEEPFGPLAVIRLVDSVDEAVAEANRLAFGLAAYGFTASASVAERLSKEIEAGTVAINHWSASWPDTPFGGVKDSGVGVEGGTEGILAFCQTKFVSQAH